MVHLKKGVQQMKFSKFCSKNEILLFYNFICLVLCDMKRHLNIIEPRHEISNNVVCATSKGSDQPAHTRSLIRAFASRLNIL